MSSPVQFKNYQILRIDYKHTPVDKEVPIGGKIPDPVPDIRVHSENKNEFVVKLNSKIIPETDNEEHQCPLSLEIELVGFFELTGDLEEEERNFHMAVSAPSMLFGIIRSWVSQITANSGIGPLLLPSVQFGEVLEEGEEESTIEEA